MVDSQNLGNLPYMGSKEVGGGELGVSVVIVRGYGWGVVLGRKENSHLVGSRFPRVIYRPPTSEFSGVLVKNVKFQDPTQNFYQMAL